MNPRPHGDEMAGASPDKKAPKAPLLKLAILEDLRRFGELFLHRAGIQALGIDVAVDELDHGHRRVVEAPAVEPFALGMRAVS